MSPYAFFLKVSTCCAWPSECYLMHSVVVSMKTWAYSQRSSCIISPSLSPCQWFFFSSSTAINIVELDNVLGWEAGRDCKSLGEQDWAATSTGNWAWVCGCMRVCVLAATERTRCCCSVHMGHSDRVKVRDEKAINGVRVPDSRGGSANCGGDMMLLARQTGVNGTSTCCCVFSCDKRCCKSRCGFTTR